MIIQRESCQHIAVRTKEVHSYCQEDFTEYAEKGKRGYKVSKGRSGGDVVAVYLHRNRVRAAVLALPSVLLLDEKAPDLPLREELVITRAEPELSLAIF